MSDSQTVVLDFDYALDAMFAFYYDTSYNAIIFEAVRAGVLEPKAVKVTTHPCFLPTVRYLRQWDKVLLNILFSVCRGSTIAQMQQLVRDAPCEPNVDGSASAALVQAMHGVIVQFVLEKLEVLCSQLFSGTTLPVQRSVDGGMTLLSCNTRAMLRYGLRHRMAHDADPTHPIPDKFLGLFVNVTDIRA